MASRLTGTMCRKTLGWHPGLVKKNGISDCLFQRFIRTGLSNKVCVPPYPCREITFWGLRVGPVVSILPERNRSIVWPGPLLRGAERARMAELVDAVDSKSTALTGVRVRLSLRAP
jgi:hypothetical protein